MLQLLDKKFAARLLAMVDTKLVTSRHTRPWCDEIIAAQDEPPHWILELAVKTYKGDVEATIREFAFSPPFVESENLDDFHIACFFLRYERGELSWASFLNEAGQYADAAEADPDCEHWYAMLNALEAAEFDNALENQQVAETRPILERAHGEATALLTPILEASRRQSP